MLKLWFFTFKVPITQPVTQPTPLGGDGVIGTLGENANIIIMVSEKNKKNNCHFLQHRHNEAVKIPRLEVAEHIASLAELVAYGSKTFLVASTEREPPLPAGHLLSGATIWLKMGQNQSIWQFWGTTFPCYDDDDDDEH